jgi:DNA repair photolyase
MMPKGRGANVQPANPYLAVRCDADLEHVADDPEYFAEYRQILDRPPTEYLPDESQSIVAENSSPDVGFHYSINPYRGCAHGCSYCYARPTHEYLGFSAGLDFETKVLVKYRAAELFRDWLARPSWQPETIAFSGVTDCYQPAEREFRITRGCLAVAAECRQPVGIVTKNALVARDLDLLTELAAHRAVRVCVSITTLDATLARTMEPRTSSPEARLRTIRELSAAGVPTQLMLAPVIPGLNDSEISAIMTAAREAGAEGAAYVLLRLPTTVRPVFLDWLRRTYPDRVGRVETLVRSTRGGRLNDSQFGRRQRGTGNVAQLIADTFALWRTKLGFTAESEPLNRDAFRPPTPTSAQLHLF